MADFEMIMPKMGESITEATIIRWTKNEGDLIAVDETVLEIATDKVDSEVPSSKAGILKKKLYKEGDVVAVNKPIAIVELSGQTSNPVAQTQIPKVEETVLASIKIETSIQEIRNSNEMVSGGNHFYSPLVLNIAREENVSMVELEKIKGSGNENRVTKRDILNYVANRKSVETPINVESVQTTQVVEASKISTPSQTSAPKLAVSISGGDEIIEMSRLRRLIADHMVMSKRTSPHVTSFVEADVTNMVLWRNRVKNDFEKREDEKLTFTPLFIECVTKAIRDFPMINVSVDGHKIIKRKSINIGMAAALPNGNLIVPVIRNADMMNLIGITKSVNDLARRARQNQLKPDEIQGGTFTLTNVGGFGNVMGTPIINQPQVAILATGTIKKKPAVIETEFGDVIAIRHLMFLSLSYDHRVVDGSLGGIFLRKIADYMEQWDVNREV